MPRGYVKKSDDWGGTRSSWDKQEAKPNAPERRYNRRCRCCGIFLVTPAEDKIGVHIACVQAVNIRQRTLGGIQGRPRYGTPKG